MITFLAFLVCAYAAARLLAFVGLPVINRVISWQHMGVVRRSVRRIGRDAVLAAVERRRATPGATCATPDPVLDRIKDSAVSNCERIATLSYVIVPAFVLAGGALSAWVFYW